MPVSDLDCAVPDVPDSVLQLPAGMNMETANGDHYFEVLPMQLDKKKYVDTESVGVEELCSAHVCPDLGD